MSSTMVMICMVCCKMHLQLQTWLGQIMTIRLRRIQSNLVRIPMGKRRREVQNDNDQGVQQLYVRGASTLPKVFKQARGLRLLLIWKDNHPVGLEDNPSLYSETCDVLMVLEHRFDWIKSWVAQNDTDKDCLWEFLKDMWEVDDDKKDYTIRQICSEVYRNKKNKWKQNYYSVYDTYKERVSNTPEQLRQEDWVKLVEFWDSPEHQAISARNKENQAKQIAKHTTGRISFPRLKEKINMEEGATPTLGDFFVRTHVNRKTHNPLDEQSREYIEKVKELAGRDETGTPNLSQITFIGK